MEQFAELPIKVLPSPFDGGGGGGGNGSGNGSGNEQSWGLGSITIPLSTLLFYVFAIAALIVVGVILNQLFSVNRLLRALVHHIPTPAAAQ